MEMGIVRSVFWRRITKGDFFNIERALDAGPSGGGGQLYIDIPLGGGVSLEEFGEFFSGAPLALDDSRWHPFQLQVYSASHPLVVAPLTLTPRRGQNRRYRIANQNRQATGGQRHPAWSEDRGFPKAPDDVRSPSDPRMPDLSYLKVFVARTDSGIFLAGFTDSSSIPQAWPRRAGLEVLFDPNDGARADGVFHIPADIRFSAEQLAEGSASPSGATRTATGDTLGQSRVIRRTEVSSLRRRVGTASAPRPLDPRADLDEAVTIQAPRASEAEDWVECRLKELNSSRELWRIGNTSLETIPLEDGYLPGADLIVLDPRSESPDRFVEVKSASGSLPASIRLTATELQRAKLCASDGVPYDIWVVVFDNTGVTGSVIAGFEREAVMLTIDDLAGLEIRIATKSAV